MKKVLLTLLFYAGIPILAGLHCAVLIFGSLPIWAILVIVPGVTALLYVLLRRKLPLRFAARVNAVIAAALSVCLMTALLIGTGSLHSAAFRYGFRIAAFPFFIPFFFFELADQNLLGVLCVFLTYAAAALTCACLSGRCGTDRTESESRPFWRKALPYLISAAVCLVCGAVSLSQYRNRPEVRYAGHGFAYMHGYSSTDFTDYTVYGEYSKLVELDHQPDLVIENEKDMPVMDGAEACYPVYAALAKAVYRDIDKIELDASRADDDYTNGKIVSFTNTIEGFIRLTEGEVDLFFGARPSKEQFEYAEEAGVPLTVTPIGREGFVFFVEEDNPVDNLTSEQIRAIYHGDITNWKEVGGKNQAITAFQRPNNSGSQTMMEYFMGDVSLKEPLTYETVGAMEGVIRKVAEYANEAGAMGYTFRYFLEGLHQEKGVKILSVDGVASTRENIENGSYPLTVGLCLVTRTNDPNPNVQKMIDFILSADGQTIIRETGYAGLEPQN